MPRRPTPPAIALTSTGQVLVNVVADLPKNSLRKLQEELGLRELPFVGAPLASGDVRQLIKRLDDAAAEVLAKVQAPEPRATPRGRAQ